MAVAVAVLAGLGLKTEQFSNAFQRLPFNIFVQFWSFCITSGFVYIVSRGLIELGVLDRSLGDGMVMCACLPMTISSVSVMTQAAGGDEAAAVFNSAFGNFLGVFVSPLLIFGYLGVAGDVELGGVMFKLALRVVLPVMVGQLLQRKSKFAVGLTRKYKRYFLKLQMYALLFLVYTVFCGYFSNGGYANHASDIFVMILVLFVLFCLLLLMSWMMLKIFFANQPQMRVMGLMGCVQKTVSVDKTSIVLIVHTIVSSCLFHLFLCISVFFASTR
jgi:solute carrier family 10 (sodium/bile acid cotransporter), member 7